MNQQKIGTFLKELRNEKDITQEQLAERFCVSRRTVSRWETGNNMPDLDILIEMADFYDVDLRELLDGERKSEKMNKELEETVLKAADYSNEEKRRMTKKLHWMFIAAVISFIFFFTLLLCEPDERTFFYGYAIGVTVGIPFIMVITGAIMTGKYAARIYDFNRECGGGKMKDKKMTIIWGVSLLITGVTVLFTAGAHIAGIDLPDILVRVSGVFVLIALPVFAFASVKIFFSH